MGRLTFVTGGARSGKSRFAEEAAAAAGAPVVYLATMEAGDAELTARVARHRARRPAAWTTVEAPLEVAAALGAVAPGATVLLDCLSLWVNNLLGGHEDDADPAHWDAAIDACLARATEVLALQAGRPGAMVVVTNEVGLGIVPLGALTRAYRDALGLVNQAFAAAADEAVLLVSGLPLRLK